jgi:hypothetical protein
MKHKRILLFICLSVLFGGCLVLQNLRVKTIKVDNSNIIVAHVMEESGMYAFRIAGGELDSFMVQITTSRNQPEEKECHIIHPKNPGYCVPIKKEHWKYTETNGAAANEVELIYTAYFKCKNRQYKLLAHYKGGRENMPKQEIH